MPDREKWLCASVCVVESGNSLYLRGTVMCDPVMGHTAVKSKDGKIYVTTTGEENKKIIIFFVSKAPIKCSSCNLFTMVISIAFAH